MYIIWIVTFFLLAGFIIKKQIAPHFFRTEVIIANIKVTLLEKITVLKRAEASDKYSGSVLSANCTGRLARAIGYVYLAGNAVNTNGYGYDALSSDSQGTENFIYFRPSCGWSWVQILAPVLSFIPNSTDLFS